MSSDLRREIGALSLLAASLFAAVALVTYQEVDLVGPQPGSANLCGRAGEAVARFLLQGFGYSGWIPILCAAFWGVALLVGRGLKIGLARVLGLAVLLLAAATLMSDMLGETSRSLPDPGGLVGVFLLGWLVERVSLGTMGTRILLVLLAIISLMLASDFLFYASIRAAALRWRAWRRRRTEPAAGGADEQAEMLEDGEDWEDEEEDEEEDDEEAAEEDEAAGRAADPLAAAPSGTVRLGRIVERICPDTIRRLVTHLSRFFAGAAIDDAAAETTAAGGRREEAIAAGPSELAEDGEAFDLSDDAAAEPARGRRGGRRSGRETIDSGADLRPRGAPAREPDADPAAAEDLGEVEDPRPRRRRRSRRKRALTTPLADAGGFGSDPVRVAPPPVSPEHPYGFPPIDLLGPARPVSSGRIERHARECSKTLERTLSSFRIEAEVVEICRGPVVTMYELELAPGTKVDRIRALEDDLAMALKARKVRIVAPLSGKSTVGIEVPNAVRETVGLRELLEEYANRDRDLAIPVMLGKDVAGRALIDDLARMPHLLVAGATGSGKSVCLNSIIMSILFTRSPEQVKLILIDPKMVELSSFAKIAHLMCPVITDIKRVGNILEWAVQKMEARYDTLHRVGVRNIYAFNELSAEDIEERLGREPACDDERRMAFIVIIVDELADLMMASGKEVEIQITRLAQKSRAVGIHVILATQRPSTNVITGLIKANMPTRVSFMVASKIDSRVVLDVNGAEKLLGAGDMLYLTPRSSDVVRAQCSYVDDREIRSVVKSIRETCSPEYSQELVQVRRRRDEDPSQQDDLWEEAVRFVLDSQRGSASLLQRRFKVGYTRASRLIDMMFEQGLLGEYKGSQAREVLCSLEDWEEQQRTGATASS